MITNAIAKICAPWSSDQPPIVISAISPAPPSRSSTVPAFVAFDSAFSRLGWRITTS